MRAPRGPSPRGALAVAILLVGTSLGGCAMKGDVRELQDEIRSLAIRQDSLLVQLQAQTRSTQDTIRTQSDQMFDFRGDISRQLREISQSLRTLEALAGENQRAIVGVRDQLGGRGGAPANGGGGSAPPTGGAGSEQLIPGGSGGDPDQLWSAAMQQYDRESLNSAQRAFQEFLTKNPTSDRAPDAHYFLADILARQDRPTDALEAFLRIPSLFPTAQKVPDAMYRAGVLQVELGHEDDARVTLERIVNTYPGTLIATLARDKLAEIG